MGILSVATHGHVASQPVLMPGAMSVDCLSALRVGVATCGEGMSNSDRTPSVTEAQVTEHLAQYGKPPREAIRALLDPSDANIAAWVRKQRQLISIAAYVAARMTEMQSQFEANSSDSTMLSSQVRAMIQMRVTLFLNAASASSQAAARALQQVVARYPSIDGRIVQLGFQLEGQPFDWLANLETALPVSTASSEAIGDDPVPSLLIEDLRFQASRRIDVTNITAQRICDQIVALRASAETHDQASRSSWLTK